MDQSMNHKSDTNKLARYILVIAAVAVVLSLVWYFIDIVAYILVAAVIAVMSQPIADRLRRLRIRKFQLPTWAVALLTILIDWGVIVLFFGLFIPLIAGKVSQLANIDLTMLVGSYEAELARLETAVRDYFSIESDWSLSSALVGELSTLVDWSQINNVLTSTISFVGSAVIALFSVTFITFYFLKEEGLFAKMIYALTPNKYLDNIRRAGTEIFFRLGQTIEHGPKKYGSLPPKDYAKWARICEHVIRHYNEGWGWGLDNAHTTVNVAWSNQFNIVYWEIWNEPDLDPADVGLPKNPRCWGGTVTNFFNFYETAAKHLKGRFPGLKIGGPALCGNMRWAERFLAYCRDNAVPLDFFSWHIYATEPKRIADRADATRKLMDKYGFRKSESILNEWNYVKGWVDDWLYSLEVESGSLNQKCAAFIMATMVDCQSKPVDMLMFYDARLNSGMNSMFSRPSLLPMKGYYPFYAWSKLADHGTQVACRVVEGRGKASDANTGTVFKSENGKPIGSFRAVAAKGKDGSGALIIARYSEDNNVTDTALVKVSVASASLVKARCHLTDSVRTYTETPLDIKGDGSAVIRMQPNSFAVIEW